MQVRNMKKASFILLSVFVLFSCVKVVKPLKLKIVVSIYPYAMLVREVGGDSVDVSVVLPPGASPHTFEPTPSTVNALKGAHLLIINGAGLDNWIEPAVKVFREKKEGRVFVVTDGESLLPIAETEIPNPHIWLSPRRMKRFVTRLKDELILLAPSSSAYFVSRAESTLYVLDRLDKTLDSLFSSYRGKGFIAVEPALSYIAYDYGLVELGFVTEDPSRQLSPSQLKRITERIKTHRLKSIISQKGIDQKPIAGFAKELGLKVIVADPIGAPDDTLTNTYEKFMLYNANLIISGL